MPNGDIIVIEGMHRACAVTMIAFDKKVLDTDVFVVITDWPDANPPKLGTGWESDDPKKQKRATIIAPDRNRIF